jgi:dephospho-CoA kinase
MENKTLIVGVTGGIGSGKSTVCEILEKKYGIPVFNSDKRGSMISEYHIKDKMIDRFGKHILKTDGSINRKKVANIVFTYEDERKLLVKWGKPYLIEMLCEFQSVYKDEKFIIIESALLFEEGLQDLVDDILTVTTNKGNQISRVHRRDGRPTEQIKQIIDIQLPQEAKVALSDHEIINNGTLQDLKDSVDAFYLQINE